jgi:hypothetical protein
MYEELKHVLGFKNNLKYVSTCPESPMHWMAFCNAHTKEMQGKGVPTTLKDYLNYKKSHKTTAFSTLTGRSAGDCQGTVSALSNSYSELCNSIDSADEVIATITSCNKDTGEKVTLQKWTRGIWLCVNGGGHIQTWQPLYKSEGPAQVFLLVLLWLVSEFGTKGRNVWKQITLSYDNMCHLNNLTVAQNDLPLPGDLKYIWKDVNKIIDELHIKNHKDPKCQSLYNPKRIKNENPNWNTVACEQTFAWMNRYRKIMCAMTKDHFHFYMHRLVKRRSKYISYCYTNGKKPIAPKPKLKD